jgi:REP element-mobilizing transposase RayT
MKDKPQDQHRGIPATQPDTADETFSLRENALLPAAVGWTYRGYLPHFDDQETPQFITFRLADSVPAQIIEQWKRELGLLASTGETNERNQGQTNSKLRMKIEKYLDSGFGDCLLKSEENASVVANALQHFDGVRYQLLSWVVMPNHVHALCRQFAGWPLSTIVKSWKSFTAHKINRQSNRSGTLWQADYFDRYIRNETHFLATAHYIETNPVAAGLCESAADWPWSFAYRSADVSSAGSPTRNADVSSAVSPTGSADVSSAVSPTGSADVSSAVPDSANMSSAAPKVSWTSESS